jgi:hypothetical protein
MSILAKETVSRGDAEAPEVFSHLCVNGFSNLHAG